MWIVFDPGKENDLPQVQIPVGHTMLMMVRGKKRELPDAVAQGLLKSNPELYKQAQAPTAAELAAEKKSAEEAAAPKTEEPKAQA